MSADGGTRPLWSPDGRELFYLDEGRLFVVPVMTEPTFAPGSPEMLFGGIYYGTGGCSYDISPDGERFFIVKEATATNQTTTAPQVILVQNWFEELRRLVPTNRRLLAFSTKRRTPGLIPCSRAVFSNRSERPSEGSDQKNQSLFSG